MSLKRTPLKRGNSLKKGKSLKKQSDRYKEGAADRKEYGEKMMKLFTDHWSNNKPYCKNCQHYLGMENKTIFHDHLLPKSKHPNLAFEMDNLWLCCGVCHGMKEGGFPHPLHKEAIEKAKERFLN